MMDLCDDINTFGDASVNAIDWMSRPIKFVALRECNAVVSKSEDGFYGALNTYEFLSCELTLIRLLANHQERLPLKCLLCTNNVDDIDM